MKKITCILLTALSLGIFTSCKEDKIAGIDGPVIVKMTPENGATGIDAGKLNCVLTYDQNIKSPTDKRNLITLTPEASISSIRANGTDLTIGLEELQAETTYTLVIGEGAVSGFKSGQKAAKEVRLNFTTKAQEVIPTPEPEKDYELAPVKELSNPNATPEAKKVYSFLLENSGRKVLTGVQSEGTANNNGHINLIAEKTGRHPALAGYDYIFAQYSPTPEGWSWVVNYDDISAQKEQWENNGLVSFMWHWNVPESKTAWENGVNNKNFDGYNFYSDKTSFSITKALKEGTWQHDFIMQDMEKVAGWLKKLQDANIPVIWRPLHEAAGNYNLYGVTNNAWFWWGRGGAEPCKQLYRLMRDTFEQKYGLNNLIWVWTLDATQAAKSEWAKWYPGDDYVDIVGTDIYADDTDSKPDQYQACVNLSKGKKLVAVTECGNIPNPQTCLGNNEKWNWFMAWSSGTDNYKLNTDNYWKQIMSSGAALAREDMPSLK